MIKKRSKNFSAFRHVVKVLCTLVGHGRNVVLVYQDVPLKLKKNNNFEK